MSFAARHISQLFFWFDIEGSLADRYSAIASLLSLITQSTIEELRDSRNAASEAEVRGRSEVDAAARLAELLKQSEVIT